MFKPEANFLTKLKTLQKEYPQDKLILNDLYFDLKSNKSKSNGKFGVYLISSWSLIYFNTVTKGPLPIFRKYGLIFKTHRVFRHYLYSGLLCGYLAYGAFYKSLKATEKKVDDVIGERVKNDDGFVRPLKPMLYRYSH